MASALLLCLSNHKGGWPRLLSAIYSLSLTGEWSNEISTDPIMCANRHQVSEEPPYVPLAIWELMTKDDPESRMFDSNDGYNQGSMYKVYFFDVHMIVKSGTCNINHFTGVTLYR